MQWDDHVNACMFVKFAMDISMRTQTQRWRLTIPKILHLSPWALSKVLGTVPGSIDIDGNFHLKRTILSQRKIVLTTGLSFLLGFQNSDRRTMRSVLRRGDDWVESKWSCRDCCEEEDALDHGAGGTVSQYNSCGVLGFLVWNRLSSWRGWIHLIPVNSPGFRFTSFRCLDLK